MSVNRRARRARRVALIAAAAVACAGGASRASLDLPPAVAAPPRPMLRGGAVAASMRTNDAAAYYSLGTLQISTHPDSAAEAFYWAARLDPWWAEPLYARGIALLLTDVIERRRPSPAALHAADSLVRLALARDPFLVRRFDYLLTGRPLAFTRKQIRDPGVAGYWAFQDQEFAEAADLLAKELARHPARSGPRIMRAQALYQLRRYDSAGVEITRLLDTLTARDTSGPLAPYASKEMLYYALGMARVQQGDTVGARDAFGRALSENFAFYMAHSRLAGLAIASGDTARAVGELAQAVDVNGTDAALRFFYGYVLWRARRLDESEEQLARAIALNSDFALPYEYLGRVAEARGDTAAAVVSYRAFLAHAHRQAADFATITERLGVLGGAAAADTVKR